MDNWLIGLIGVTRDEKKLRRVEAKKIRRK